MQVREPGWFYSVGLQSNLNMEIKMGSRKILFLSTALVLVLTLGSGALAETVTTKTVVTQQDLPNVEQTNFAAFDLNGDNVLSMAEVGEKLFYIFDTDGNEVIDNIEFTNRKVMTIIPMEKQTFTFLDYDSDGNVDKSKYTHDTFIQQSRLIRFDKDMDGLSPADFIEMSFLELDDNNSKAIELDEWKEEYLVKVIPPVAEQERYN